MAGEMAERIGARIRERRNELGMKQRELADKLGSDAIDNQRISDWERGVNRPSDRYMEKLAVALERDVAWFFREDVDAPTPSPFAGADGANALEGALGEVLAEIKAQLARQTEVLDEIKGHASRVETMLEQQRELRDETDELAESIRQATRELAQPQASPPASPRVPPKTGAAKTKRAAAPRTR